jgi:alkylation response protein AidB-like acyl-CoA dehydrogenase
MRAVDVMDRTAATARRQTLGAEAEDVRREARDRFSRFVLDRVNPGSCFRDRAGLPLDHHLFEEASELGLLQFALPAEVGGAGRDKFDWGVVIAEIARISRDPGFPVLLDITVENCELIMSSGRPELIDRYVPDLVAGRRYAVQAAYESRDPYDYQTTARFEGGEWVLNGAKRFVAGAVFADVFIVYLREEASNDILAFVVERDDPGVAPVRLNTMGLCSMGFGQVILHDVRLPEWRLLWRSDALSELNTYARGRRMMTACGVLGTIEGIVETCVESLSTRKRSGRRVLDYPNVERSVGEMRVLVEAARSIIYRALDNTRAPGRDPYFDELATTAKHQVSECALRVGELVMNLQGGEGYMSSFPWERFVRDILGLIGGQGSQELLLIQLGQRSIVGLEGRQLREDGAQRTVAKLADAWWALSALDAKERADAPNRPDLADAVLDVLTAAGLARPVDAKARGELAALRPRRSRPDPPERSTGGWQISRRRRGGLWCAPWRCGQNCSPSSSSRALCRRRPHVPVYHRIPSKSFWTCW